MIFYDSSDLRDLAIQFIFVTCSKYLLDTHLDNFCINLCFSFLLDVLNLCVRSTPALLIAAP